MTTTVPSFKLEDVSLEDVKAEPMDDSPSPYAASEGYADDGEVDDPELDFKNARQDLWLSKVPKYLWESLSGLKDTDEIDIGTIRIEGSLEQPQRVSLMLNSGLSVFKNVPREYNITAMPAAMRKSKKTGQVMIFSEKDKPGYKARNFAWDDLDEDGNPGQGRSYLYDEQRRKERRKENKGRYIPYSKRPIPKITAITGTVTREYETLPVENEEHKKFQRRKASALAVNSERAGISLVSVDPSKHYATITTSSERREINKQAQVRKQAAKDNRAARWDRNVLLDELFERFREHRFWGLRDLRARLRQPEQWIKENLGEIALMHTYGDFNGKWELKPEYKSKDAALMNSVGSAPKADDSDVDMKSEDDEDFEDVAA